MDRPENRNSRRKEDLKSLIISTLTEVFGWATEPEPTSLAALRLQEQYRTFRFLIMTVAFVVICLALVLSGNADQIGNILGHRPFSP